MSAMMASGDAAAAAAALQLALLSSVSIQNK